MMDKEWKHCCEIDSLKTENQHLREALEAVLLMCDMPPAIEQKARNALQKEE